MKGTYEDIIKALRCLASGIDDCECPGCMCVNGGESTCDYDQHVYDLSLCAYCNNADLLRDTAELLEHYQEIDALYLQKCEEVNKLRDLVSGKFDPDKYVEFYNSLIAKESVEHAEPIEPHENI